METIDFCFDYSYVKMIGGVVVNNNAKIVSKYINLLFWH